MTISKAKREAVYQKYNGHCAYCGREILYQDMQVDHFIPLRSFGVESAESNDISNLMPACRMCNHYKRANSLETFRRAIEAIPQKLRRDYIYKIGVAYGNIIENEKPVVFYFEREIAKRSTNEDDDTMEWLDNADSYLCPVCRTEVSTPTKYNYHCPGCGFIADRDKKKEKEYGQIH